MHHIAQNMPSTCHHTKNLAKVSENAAVTCLLLDHKKNPHGKTRGDEYHSQGGENGGGNSTI